MTNSEKITKILSLRSEAEEARIACDFKLARRLDEEADALANELSF